MISPLCPCLLAQPDLVPTAEKSGRRQRRAWLSQEARKAGGRRSCGYSRAAEREGPRAVRQPGSPPLARCSVSSRAQLRPVKATSIASPGEARPRAARRVCEPCSTVLVSASLWVSSSAAAVPLVPGWVARIAQLRRRLTGGPVVNVAPQAQL